MLIPKFLKCFFISGWLLCLIVERGLVSLLPEVVKKLLGGSGIEVLKGCPSLDLDHRQRGQNLGSGGLAKCPKKFSQHLHFETAPAKAGIE